ncbi:MAG: hypothetical protein JW795_16220, partial [Chitinivibrionales bacterium]|nr:hypothetical protein [Chitinivibrionales bacterium]
NFSNKNNYIITQPLGCVTSYTTSSYSVQSFIADVSQFSIGGINVTFVPPSLWFDLGYYFDVNQYRNGLDKQNSRFILIDSIISSTPLTLPGQDSVPSAVSIGEVGAGFIHGDNEEISTKIVVNYAATVGSNNRGFVLHCPKLTIAYGKMLIGALYSVEGGKLLSGHFGPMYLSNRQRMAASGKDTVYLNTQNNILSTDRRAYGAGLSYAIAPLQGLTVEAELHHDFLTEHPFMDFINSHYVPDTINTKNNFAFRLQVSVNEQFFKPIAYARLILEQTHGGYYPKMASYFASWGFSTRLDASSSELFWNLAFEGGIYFSYLDLFTDDGTLGLNNNIDGGDTMFEFYLGIKRGFYAR